MVEAQDHGGVEIDESDERGGEGSKAAGKKTDVPSTGVHSCWTCERGWSHGFPLVTGKGLGR